MSTLEAKVREDGSVLIPADQVAAVGAAPGQHVAVELHAKPQGHKPTRGILKGALPPLGLEEFRADRAERLAEFEQHRDL